MCGFGGVLNSSEAVDKRFISSVSEAVKFRGPDSCGIKIYDKNLNVADQGIHALFFNRLAIIDLDKRSDQPFEDQRYSLIFNGEVYNYKDLRKELLNRGITFTTSSDTEVLFNALKCWGTEAVSKLNGMFSFCFIDRVEQKFIIARDRTGIKPLYYMQLGKTLLFASEAYSIKRLLRSDLVINEDALNMYLWMQFIPSPYTAFKDVYKLIPGSYLTGSLDDLNARNKITPIIYWDAYNQAAICNEEQQHGNLESLLVETLNRQLIADVPLGLFLSSGVDSSLLAAVINKHFAKEKMFNFFTVSFSEQTDSDESTDASKFIDGFRNKNLSCIRLAVDPNYLGDHLDNLYDFVDEPFGDPATLLNWVISKKAKEYVTVALSGDGADELFWGYPRYHQWENQIINLPGKLSFQGVTAKYAYYLIPSAHHRELSKRALEPDKVKRHFALFLHPGFAHLKKHPVFQNGIWALNGVEKIQNRSDLTSILDIKTYLADAMLYKVDHASMAASLEVRVPYLDNSILDFALKLPKEIKSDKYYTYKAPLKHLLKKLAPHYIIDKPKKGFNFPLHEWLSTEWKDRVLSSITKESLNDLGLGDRNYMEIINKYYKGNRRYSLPVWYLLNLVMWHNKVKSIS